MEQKKRSQAIDKKLEEDSRRLRRECKILLLGSSSPASGIQGMLTFSQALEKVANQQLSNR
jgi:hypothetical protein